jgi:capsular polysaccharide transport system permease protein
MSDSSRVRIGQTSFLQSLAIQSRVIHALVLREIFTRYGRHNIGFLWLFIEPMMFSVGITILWTLTGLSKGAITAAGFALTGYSSLILFRNTVNHMTSAASSNKGLLYHQQVKILDIVLARTFLEFSSVTTSFVFLTIVFQQLGLMDMPADPLTALIGWFYLMWFVWGMGMVAAYLGAVSELFDRVLHVMMYLTMPLSGAFSMLSWLPPEAQNILLWSPMANAVEMLREGYFGTEIKAMYSVQYLVEVNAALTLLGLLLVRKIRRGLDDE